MLSRKAARDTHTNSSLPSRAFQLRATTISNKYNFFHAIDKLFSVSFVKPRLLNSKSSLLSLFSVFINSFGFLFVCFTSI